MPRLRYGLDHGYRKSLTEDDSMRRIYLPEYLCVCRDENCEITIGKCHCGCGESTKICKMSDSRKGSVRGHPCKYIRGHNIKDKNKYKSKTKTPKKFYVYAYLRWRLSEMDNAGTPYYIGKGTGRRAWINHGRNIPRPREDKYIHILADNLSEIDALQIEVLFIYLYGRMDLGTGTLRNRTGGGDGVSNVSEDCRNKRSQNQKRRWEDELTRNSILKSFKKRLKNKSTYSTLKP